MIINENKRLFNKLNIEHLLIFSNKTKDKALKLDYLQLF